MCFTWVSQKAMLLLCRDAVVDNLPICAVLIELRSAFFKRSCPPELRTQLLILVQHLVLFKQLREHDVE